jgi:hypothetical protein
MIMNESDVRKIVQSELRKNSSAGSPRVPRHNHDGVSNTRVHQKDVVPPIAFAGSITFAQNAVYTLNLATPNATTVLFNGAAVSSKTSYTLASGISAGANSATLLSTWEGSSQNIGIRFSNGNERSVFFTNGSLTLSWAGGLTSSASNIITSESSSVKALVNGSAYLQKAYAFQPQTSTSVVPGGPPYPLNIPNSGSQAPGEVIQGCSSILIDTSSLSNAVARVNSNNLVFVEDLSGTYNALANIMSYENNALQIQVTLASGWQIIGQFMIF